MDGFLVVVTTILVSLGIYFFPSIVGFYKRKKNTGAIFVTNLFFGWTGIGWVIALIWAVTND